MTVIEKLVKRGIRNCTPSRRAFVVCFDVAESRKPAQSYCVDDRRGKQSLCTKSRGYSSLEQQKRDFLAFLQEGSVHGFSYTGKLSKVLSNKFCSAFAAHPVSDHHFAVIIPEDPCIPYAYLREIFRPRTSKRWPENVWSVRHEDVQLHRLRNNNDYAAQAPAVLDLLRA